MKRLNEQYSKLVLNAAEKNWDNNKDKMLKRGIDKNSYMLGYLHGWEACFSTYDLDHEGLEDNQHGVRENEPTDH